MEGWQEEQARGRLYEDGVGGKVMCFNFHVLMVGSSFGSGRRELELSLLSYVTLTSFNEFRL